MSCCSFLRITCIKNYQNISNYFKLSSIFFSRFGIVKFLIQTASIYRLMNEQHQVLIWWRSPAWRDLPPPCMRRRNMFRQSSVHMMYTVYTHITHHNTICNVYLYSIQYTYIIVSTHTHTRLYIYITHLQLDACPMFCATIDIMLSCAYNCIYT